MLTYDWADDRSPHVVAAVASEMREALAVSQSLPFWALRLPAALESMFASETDAERNRQLQLWTLAWLGFSWLTLALDVVSVPDGWQVALLLRLGVVTPAAILSFRCLRTNPMRWRRTLASIATPATSLLTVLLVFATSAVIDGFRADMVLLLGIFWTNVLNPMRLRDSFVFSVFALALGGTINLVAGTAHHATVQHPDILAAGLMMLLLSLLSRAASERGLRRSFTAGVRLRIRNENLTRSNSKLLEMSNTDVLTGLANRRFFDLTLEQAWLAATSAQSWIALMMIDVDHFKQFNDAAGHLEGDRCLAIVARTIASHIRVGDDLAARFGGEEFVVLMPTTECDEAYAMAERVRAALAALQVFHPGRIGHGFLSVSIGVVATHGNATFATSAALVAAADAALYKAKAAGRDRVVVGAT